MNKKIIEIQKLIGSIGYVLNNWEVAVKGTKYNKLGIKFRAGKLIEEFEKLEKTLTEFDKNNPLYTQIMEQMHNVILVYTACIDATFFLNSEEVEELNNCILDKLEELKEKRKLQTLDNPVK